MRKIIRPTQQSDEIVATCARCNWEGKPTLDKAWFFVCPRCGRSMFSVSATGLKVVEPEFAEAESNG